LKRSSDHDITVWNQASFAADTLTLIGEEPLSIRIQGNPYAVIMRTPGEEKAHVAGFCLAEGVVDRPEEIVSIARCDGEDANVIAVTLTPERRVLIDDILDRREFISQTSCGICGKEVVKDLQGKIRPVEDDTRFDIREARRRLDEISRHQPLREETRAAHTALIFNRQLDLISAAEDVGRHNALDKAVGKLFLAGRVADAGLLVMASRVSYELVQKAARARIPVILAVSRPTALAVELAAALDMTLATLARGVGLFIFTAPHRLTVAS
jgi:FdhD protein